MAGLSGNSNTCMLAAISPSQLDYYETLSTLNYAARIRQVVFLPPLLACSLTHLLACLA